MAKKTLYQILDSQDLASKIAQEYAEASNNGEFEASKDPICAIIINAFKNTGKEEIESEEDIDSVSTDIDYAISQLKEAKEALNS